MRKKEGSASERISAKLIGDSIFSDSGNYRGPLFARKKRNPFGFFVVIILLLALSYGLWEMGNKFAPEFTKNVRDNVRSIASEYLPDDEVKKVEVKNDRKK